MAVQDPIPRDKNTAPKYFTEAQAEDLLTLTQEIATALSGGGGGGSVNYALETGGNLEDVANSTAVAAASLNVLDDWDESDRAKVNPIVGQTGLQGGAGASSANTVRVAIASDANTVAVATVTTLTTVTNPVGIKGADGSAISSNSNPVPVSDAGGSLTVDGTVDLAVTTGGGWSKYSNVALSTTVQTVKGSAGKLGGWFIHNPSAATAYVQLFDVSSVTLGTTVPDQVFGIPTGASANIEITAGLAFSTNIKVAATTTATGSSAPATALVVNFWYK